MKQTGQTPFIQRYEFTGVVESESVSVDGVFFSVEFSRIREGILQAGAYGSFELAKELAQIQRRSRRISVKSTRTSAFVDSISSDEAYLNLNEPSHRPEKPDHLERRIGTVSFENLKITEGVPESVETKRQVTFFLAGPKELWPVTAITEMSYTGYMKMDVQGSKINLGDEYPLVVSVHPRYEFHSPEFHDEEPTQVATVYALDFVDGPSSEQLPTDQFLELAKDTADELTRLVSLLSTQRTTWFCYTLIDSGQIIHVVRRTLDCTSHVDPFKAGLVVRMTSEELRHGYRKTQELRKDGIDLRSPLVYYLAGNEAKYVEQKFTAYFLAIESLKDLYLDRHKIRSILSQTDFKSVKSKLRAVLDNEIGDLGTKEMIIDKLAELNRPSLRHSLEKMFADLGVKWRDLYPEKTEFTLIATRNQLFHASRPVGIDRLVREMERARILVEQTFLALLGLSEDAEPLNPGLVEYLTTDATEADEW